MSKCTLGQRAGQSVRTGTEKRWDTEHHIPDAGGAGGRMQEEEWDPAVSPGNGGAHASPMEGRKEGHWVHRAPLGGAHHMSERPGAGASAHGCVSSPTSLG